MTKSKIATTGFMSASPERSNISGNRHDANLIHNANPSPRRHVTKDRAAPNSEKLCSGPVRSCLPLEETIFGRLTISESYANFVEEQIQMHGRIPYLVTFQFSHLEAGLVPRLMMMEKGLEVFYGRFERRAVRNPLRGLNRSKLPILIAFPDIPVFKWNRVQPTIESARVNCGLHFHAIVLMHPDGRMWKLRKHLKNRQDLYIRAGEELISVHAKRIKHSAAFVADYCMKSMKVGRFDYSQVVVFPKSRSELSGADRKARGLHQ